MERDHIVSEIQRTALGNGGKPLGTAKFRNETGITETDWGRYWARWGDAVTEAGLSPNTKQQAYDDEFLWKLLAALTRELGHFPVVRDLKIKSRKDAEFPSHNVFQRRGSQSQLASYLLAYCGDDPQFADVAALCVPVAARSSSEREDSEPEADGFVYLIKSGSHWKIGRSNATGRRQYELSIQLPERVELLHEIATDDPVGIEAYWHRRFDGKRVNGEWFKLTSSDIRAFKRRKNSCEPRSRRVATLLRSLTVAAQGFALCVLRASVVNQHTEALCTPPRLIAILRAIDLLSPTDERGTRRHDALLTRSSLPNRCHC